MAALAVRRLLDADREAVVDLLHALNRFEGALTGDRAPEREAAAECLAENDRRVGGTGAHLVATRDGAVIGYLCFVRERAPPYVRREWRERGIVADLVVAEGARGAGVGRALLAEAEALARGAGCAHLAIGHVEGNEGAGRLYRSLGFRPGSVELLKRLGPAAETPPGGGPAAGGAA